jgi:hypothetical protein
MTARAPADDFLANFDALPLSTTPLTPEQAAAVAASRARVAAGQPGVPHAEVEQQLADRQRADR